MVSAVLLNKLIKGTGEIVDFLSMNEEFQVSFFRVLTHIHPACDLDCKHLMASRQLTDLLLEVGGLPQAAFQVLHQAPGCADG